jgi:superfamily I DNA/RNA helicase
MPYLAVTEGTATWLLGKAPALDALHNALFDDPTGVAVLNNDEFVEGPVRFSASPDGELLAFWNIDYSSGTGDDGWGFVDLGEEKGLAAQQTISREVLERSFHVISQRLRGLLIDGAFIHRTLDHGAHTCLSGRGNSARHFSIAYIERDVARGSALVHCVFVEGPSIDIPNLAADIVRRSPELDQLLQLAQQLSDPRRRRQASADAHFQRLRRSLSAYLRPPDAEDEFAKVSIKTADQNIRRQEALRTAGYNYSEWLLPSSPLTAVQRRIVTSDAISQHPIRITGCAGSGKTLLMQLLSLRCASDANQQRKKILYLTHNLKMAESVISRLDVLVGGSPELARAASTIKVTTLSRYGSEDLGLDSVQMIDPDAREAKEFQLEVLETALVETIDALPRIMQGPPEKSDLFREVKANPILLPLLTRLVMSEISIAIKGHGLVNDERRYVDSERALSRLHGILSQDERRAVFAAFRQYHNMMFEGYGVLDTDDVALSLLGKLRTPIWDLKRKEMGFDIVFVDEAHLFNENERRVFPLLTRSNIPFVPIVLALDQAQDLYAQTSAGLATLGVEGAASENLRAIHRSSKAIIRLAFFVIQRSTDLFGSDFPDFTGCVDQMPEEGESGKKPQVVSAASDQADYGKFILKRIRALRKVNLRRIAVICMAEQYWPSILEELRTTDLPLHVLESRGERLGSTHPIVVLSRPDHIGGQEFDAVVITGAEQGLVPPRVLDNDALASAVEQQVLRELYLSITRARECVVVALSHGASLTPVLNEALKAGLLEGAAENDP